MGMKPLVALLLVATLALAGCSGGTKDDDGSGSSDTTTTAAAPNTAPTAALNVSVANGTTPLNVTFQIAGADADNDTLSWALDLGDGNTTNGTALPANVTYTFASPGVFLVNLTVSDGEANATANVTVSVAALAALPDPLHFEGTLTAVPYIPQVGSPNDFVDGSSAVHEFAFTGNPASMTLTLAYSEGVLFTDVDLFITDPAGEETTSEEAGPEPPVVIESPAPGTWSVRVFAYGGEGDVDYTLDITFA